MTDKVVRAAGGVLWRPAAAGPDGVEVALVHRPRYDDWSHPKGKLEPGEHPLTAAGREVLEETGARAVAAAALPTQRYQVRSADGPVDKTVRYWAMRAEGGEFEPGEEVDQLAWLPPETASKRLSYPRDHGPLAAFLQLPPAVATVLVVRHATAGSRSVWLGDDRLRPLDADGCAQAAALGVALPAFGVTRVLAADLSRCVETLRPLADRVGVPVDLEPGLSEQTYRPAAAERRLRELSRDPGAVAVCSQGGVIPDLVGRLLRADGVRPTRAGDTARDGARVPARKASVWALGFVAGRLVAADYLARPTGED